MVASKGLTKAFALRTTDAERDTMDRARKAFVDEGLDVSLNDIVRHLIRRAEMGIPRTLSEGILALSNHTAACEICERGRPPRCMDGLYMRELNRKLLSSGPGGDHPR